MQNASAEMTEAFAKVLRAMNERQEP